VSGDGDPSGDGYGFFVIQRVKYDVVTYPDGREAVLPAGKGEAAILKYKREQQEETSVDASEVEVERIEVEGTDPPQPGERKVYAHRLTFSDGEVVQVAPDHTRSAIERWQARTARANAPVRKPQEPKLKKRRTWAAELFLPKGRERLSFEPDDWPYGLPIDEVTEVLNRLAGEGWKVLHVSEDRGLYTGPDTESDSYVTRARYMLGRA
jgi:hypothetical protein